MYPTSTIVEKFKCHHRTPTSTIAGAALCSIGDHPCLNGAICFLYEDGKKFARMSIEIFLLVDEHLMVEDTVFELPVALT
jgi:hypothetical protein